MPLNEADKDLIQAMFRDNCDCQTVRKVVPHVATTTLYRMRDNMDLFGQVRKPSSAIKRRGAPKKITPSMVEYLLDLLSAKNDLWEDELVFELWCEFDLAVDRKTIRRMLAKERLSSKVNTRIERVGLVEGPSCTSSSKCTSFLPVRIDVGGVVGVGGGSLRLDATLGVGATTDAERKRVRGPVSLLTSKMD